MSFETLLRLIQTGEPVSAGVTNRAPRQLDQNVRYVWDVLQAASMGSTVYARQQTVEAEVKVGHAVYLNTATGRFERALAQTDATTASGVLMLAASAQVWGVVATKTNATLADILLAGFETLDISEAVGGTPVAGVYYLSGGTAGRLTAQRPPVSVPVLRSTGDGRVFVIPQITDFIDRHVHHKFSLACRPAGTTTQPSPGNRHTISASDDGKPGWLPASHPIFEGKAPAGARWGYNIREHGALYNAWPPLPASSASLTWDKGLDADVGGTTVPLGPEGLCIVDRNGLWWLSDCYGDVPWPIEYDSGSSDSYSDSDNDTECPRHLRMAMDLWFTKFQFATDETVVRSLISNDPRLRVLCAANGEPATGGDLELQLNLDLIVVDNERGYLAIKSLEGSEFKRGPVCEGLYALSDNVTLTSPAYSLLDPNDPESAHVQHGPVGITVVPAETRELDTQLVRLDGVEAQHYDDFMYLGFAKTIETEIRCKIHVPIDTQGASPRLSLHLRILGRAAGTLPQLTVTGRLLPRPTAGLTVPVELPGPGDEFTISIDTTGVLDSTNQYVEATSEAFAVNAGDVLFFTVKREAGDAYAAELGLLQQVGILTAEA